MKKPLVSRISEKKGILIPLALVPAGILIFVSVQSNQAEQPEISRHEPPAEIQTITSDIQSGEQPTDANKVNLVHNQAANKKTVSNIPPSTPKKELIADSILGIWGADSYDDNHMLLSSFSLEVEHFSSKNIKGNYCYISNYGKKEDCLNEFSGTSLKSKDKANTRYLINFHSSFKNLAGKATLDLSNTAITWDLKEFPIDSGVGIPKHAILTKVSNQPAIH